MIWWHVILNNLHHSDSEISKNFPSSSSAPVVCWVDPFPLRETLYKPKKNQSQHQRPKITSVWESLGKWQASTNQLFRWSVYQCYTKYLDCTITSNRCCFSGDSCSFWGESMSWNPQTKRPVSIWTCTTSAFTEGFLFCSRNKRTLKESWKKQQSRDNNKLMFSSKGVLNIHANNSRVGKPNQTHSTEDVCQY